MHTEDRPDIDALWDYERPAESEARFRELLGRLGPRHPARAELLTQLARAQGLGRHFDAARATLDAARALLPAAPERATVRELLERGRVHNSAGAPDEAAPLFLRAWELAGALGEEGLAVDAAHMLAIVARGEEQLAWNLRALELAERSEQPGAQGWRGSLYNNIGWTHFDAGRYAEALALFELAERWRAERGQARELRIARWCVARALRALGRVDEALAIQRALAEAGEHDGYVDEELGECLLALGQATAAQPCFARAYALLAQDPWLAEREPARLERLRALGQPR